jgi:putative tryptophan/tyrosine transport system substrate-binding protein
MMRAMPTASLRSLLLICSFRAAFACLASMQMTALGVRLHVLHASTEADFEAAFATAAQLRAATLVISTPDPLFNSHAAQLGALALRHSVPAIFQLREFAAAGGLMSYGGYTTHSYRLGGVYTGRILKGEKPAADR